MLEKISKGILVAVLCVSVILGAYLGYRRYLIEASDRTVELCMDLNDVKKMVAFEKKPLEPVLDEFKKLGITSLGVFEETLPDAHTQGEIYYAKGTGILALKKFQNLPIQSERTYLYIPETQIRKRIYNQLSWVLGKESIKFLGSKMLEVNEAEEEIRNLGLGMSEIQIKYLQQKGFKIIPRVWNDPRYHLGNIPLKISALKDFGIIIFDGEEILGYSQATSSLASSLKENKIKYGYIEIINQYGNQTLRKLMGGEMVRVHSIPREELVKISKEEAIARLLRAVRERSVRLIYLRPFLPPQIDAYPIEYNLNYLNTLKTKIEEAGFALGKSPGIPKLRVEGWQILVLGLGVVISTIFLLSYFVKFHFLLDYLILFSAALLIISVGSGGKELLVQKFLASLAAMVLPSYAVISTFSTKKEIPDKGVFIKAIFLVLNITAETTIGIFLLIGLLADSRFMLGAETFVGVKLALILPILLIATYFILKAGKGSLREKITDLLETKISLLSVILGILALGALGVFVARSGNFVLPVPVLEKYFRNFLEIVLFVRPRFKEFLIGYPLLLLAAVYYLKGKRAWLWLLASLGTIAPISFFNSFTHVHTPILISVIRSINGLVLGLLVGLVVSLVLSRFIK